MAEYTDRFGFLILEPGEDIESQSRKFVDSDRRLLDRILTLLEAHEHTGSTETVDAPASGPTLTLITSDGAIPAGRRVFYVITYIDGDGLETVASLETYIDTPALVGSPNLATGDVTTDPTGGTLPPGTYFYLLTAYTDFDSLETTGGTSAHVAVAYVTETNVNTIDLPALPAGASGFNVYRRGPNEIGYRYMASINMDLATPPGTWVDDGSITPNTNRPAPTENTAISTNSIEVGIPGATPSLPVGWSWRIYRTYIEDDWENTLLATVDGDTVTYIDAGEAPSVGQPPAVGVTLGRPLKIDLEDGANVRGVLPLGYHSNVTSVEFVIDTGGALQVGDSSWAWISPFTYGKIMGFVAILDPGQVPAGQDLIVDVEVGPAGATPVYASIFPTAQKPFIDLGQQTSSSRWAVPDEVDLNFGDSVVVVVEQEGGGATPTDFRLTVVMELAVFEPEALSRDWPDELF